MDGSKENGELEEKSRAILTRSNPPCRSSSFTKRKRINSLGKTSNGNSSMSSPTLKEESSTPRKNHKSSQNQNLESLLSPRTEIQKISPKGKKSPRGSTITSGVVVFEKKKNIQKVSRAVSEGQSRSTAISSMETSLTCVDNQPGGGQRKMQKEKKERKEKKKKSNKQKKGKLIDELSDIRHETIVKHLLSQLEIDFEWFAQHWKAESEKKRQIEVSALKDIVAAGCCAYSGVPAASLSVVDSPNVDEQTATPPRIVEPQVAQITTDITLPLPQSSQLQKLSHRYEEQMKDFILYLQSHSLLNNTSENHEITQSQNHSLDSTPTSELTTPNLSVQITPNPNNPKTIELPIPTIDLQNDRRATTLSLQIRKNSAIDEFPEPLLRRDTELPKPTSPPVPSPRRSLTNPTLISNNSNNNISGGRSSSGNQWTLCNPNRKHRNTLIRSQSSHSNSTKEILKLTIENDLSTPKAKECEDLPTLSSAERENELTLSATSSSQTAISFPSSDLQSATENNTINVNDDENNNSNNDNNDNNNDNNQEVCSSNQNDEINTSTINTTYIAADNDLDEIFTYLDNIIVIPTSNNDDDNNDDDVNIDGENNDKCAKKNDNDQSNKNYNDNDDDVDVNASEVYTLVDNTNAPEDAEEEEEEEEEEEVEEKFISLKLISLLKKQLDIILPIISSPPPVVNEVDEISTPVPSNPPSGILSPLTSPRSHFEDTLSPPIMITPSTSNPPSSSKSDVFSLIYDMKQNVYDLIQQTDYLGKPREKMILEAETSQNPLAVCKKIVVRMNYHVDRLRSITIQMMTTIGVISQPAYVITPKLLLDLITCVRLSIIVIKKVIDLNSTIIKIKDLVKIKQSPLPSSSPSSQLSDDNSSLLPCSTNNNNDDNNENDKKDKKDNDDNEMNENNYENIYDFDINKPITEQWEEGCGTLNSLIITLTCPDTSDSSFMKTFITTYPSFTTSKILLKKLIERYNVPPAAAEKKLQIQLKVIIVLKHWITSKVSEFDQDLLSILDEFVNRMMTSEHHNAAQMLKSAIEKSIAMQFQDVEFSKPSLNQFKYRYSPSDMFLQTSEKDIAEQLTLISSKLFSQIEVDELLNVNWSKKSTRYKSPNVRAVIKRCNSVSFWTASMILFHQKVSFRAHVFGKFIAITKELRNLNNFDGIFAVISGLKNRSVDRLKWSKSLVSEKLQSELRELSDITYPQSSWKNYRSALEATPPPKVPFIGVFLTDLTFIEDGNSNFIKGDLINFKKRQMVYKVLQQIIVYKNTKYKIQPKEPLYSYLVQLPFLDDEDLFRVSTQREPRNSTLEDII